MIAYNLWALTKTPDDSVKTSSQNKYEQSMWKIWIWISTYCITHRKSSWVTMVYRVRFISLQNPTLTQTTYKARNPLYREQCLWQSGYVGTGHIYIWEMRHLDFIPLLPTECSTSTQLRRNVCSTLNPADCASRGLSVMRLQKSRWIL